MLARKTLAALASLAVAGAGMLFMASPAHAAVTKQTDCTAVSAVAITEAGPYEFDTGGSGCVDYVIRSDDVDREDLTFEVNVGNWDIGFNDDRAFNISPPTGNHPNNGLRITIAETVESGTVVVEFYSAQYSASSLKETYTITIGDGGGGDDGDGGGGGDGGGDGGDGGGDGGDGGGGGGGDQSSGDSGSAGSTSSSPSISLQVLDEADGSWARALEAGLVAWEKTVPVNTWQPLPNSADVVGVGKDEGKVFLGVATRPDFPVDIAQRQVDNGWGAYDMYDDQRALESVFIPAGGSMFVWTQPRLYAVWGAPSS